MTNATTAKSPVARIRSTGRFLPERVLTNADLEKMVDTSDAWIRERTGILERRLASEGMTVTDMGERAARDALEKGGMEANEVDLIIVTTATPDRWLPATSCEIQARLGCTGTSFAFDLHAACTGFLYGLSMAEGFLASGRGDTVLLISTEMMSSIIDWDDRSTCILFGDGAGAVVLERSDDERGLLSSFHSSDGNMADLLQRSAGGVARPLNEERLRNKEHMMQMAGQEVFKSAVRSMARAGSEALQEAGLTAEDVDLLVPHQANARIIRSTAKYAGVPMERVFVNLDRYGNISSATIPVALDEAAEEERIGPGSGVLMTAFGAGLTWGAVMMRW